MVRSYLSECCKGWSSKDKMRLIIPGFIHPQMGGIVGMKGFSKGLLMKGT